MFLKRMSTRNKVLWLVGVMAIAVAVGLGDFGETEQPTMAAAGTAHAANGGGAPQGPAPTRSAREVTVVDQGLGIAISTMRVPAGWDLQHDIAYDAQAGRHERFKLVLVGPRNQYARSYLGNFPYGSFNNLPFQRAVQQAVDHVLGSERLQRLELGALEPYPEALEHPAAAAMAQRMASRGQRLEAYKAEFNGERDGRRYRGQIHFMNFFSPSGGFGTLAPGSMLFALAEDYEETVRVAEEVRRTLVPNPEHDRVMTSINERLRQQSEAYARRMMDRSAVAHERRMADQKAAFASHQRNMAGLNQLQDAAHESYMKTLRSRGSFSSVGGDYGGQQAVVDQIHERSSFADPWTNSEVALDGQYKHNFTNGLGDYYRTDDPSFDPASLQGDWRRIDPLGP